MTVDTTYAPVTATGNGVTDAFAFPYLVFQSSHLSITLDGVATAAWTATGYGSQSGVTVTFTSPPANGEAIVIQRIVPYTQDTDLENFDGNPSDVTEKQFDLHAMADQQLATQVGLSITLPSGSGLTNVEITDPAGNAGRTIIVNPTEDGFIYGSSGVDLVDDITPQLGGDLDLNGFNIDFPSTANVSDVLDEDNMASNSATALATQQSIVAYVATQIPTTATTTTEGIVERATQAEVDTGTDTGRYVTPETLANYSGLGGGSLSNVVEDTTPQLGGDLDLNGNNIDFPTTANISDCLDEDTMTSNSATALATQQSIKAYVDSQAGGGTVVQGSISGLILSNDTDADHDINITAGQAADSTNAEYLTLASEQTKQIDASWATGDDAGGLTSSLTVTTNTTYHVFLVDIGGTVEVLFDTSLTCANGVTDHTVLAYRRIGSIMTDGSSNIIPFIQTGDDFVLDVPVQDTTTAPTTTAATITLSVPTGIEVVANIMAMMRIGSSTAATYALISDLSQTDTLPTSAIYNIGVQNTTTTDSTHINAILDIKTNTSGQIRQRSNRTPLSWNLNTLGWKDTRGGSGTAGAGAGGGLLSQKVIGTTASMTTTTTTMPADDTIPQNTEGAEVVTVAITPNSSTNRLVIRATVHCSHSTGADTGSIALFQDSTADALAVSTTALADNNSMSSIHLYHEMEAGTTSSTTFKIRAGHNDAGTLTVNGESGARLYGGVLISSIEIMEVSI